jgi:hypothetical protein
MGVVDGVFVFVKLALGMGIFPSLPASPLFSAWT